MNTNEVAWAAGFFDGEGCFFIRSGQEHSSSVSAAVSQMEPSTLERFCRAIGYVGTISSGTQRYKGVPKTVYHWRCNGLEDTQAVGAMLWKFLSAPKRAKFVKCMEHSRAAKRFIRNRRKQKMAESGHGLVPIQYVAKA